MSKLFDPYCVFYFILSLLKPFLIVLVKPIFVLYKNLKTNQTTRIWSANLVLFFIPVLAWLWLDQTFHPLQQLQSQQPPEPQLSPPQSAHSGQPGSITGRLKKDSSLFLSPCAPPRDQSALLGLAKKCQDSSKSPAHPTQGPKVYPKSRCWVDASIATSGTCWVSAGERQSHQQK